MKNMPSQDYDRLYSKLDSVHDKIEKLASTTGDIKTNAEGTRRAVEYQNGRVTKNEKRIEHIFTLFNRLLIGMVVFFIGIVISLVVYIYQTDRNSTSVVDAIQQATFTTTIPPETLQEAFSNMQMEVVE